jgi:hypothetical protein
MRQPNSETACCPHSILAALPLVANLIAGMKNGGTKAVTHSGILFPYNK